MTYSKAEALILSEISTDDVDRADILVGLTVDSHTADVRVPVTKACEGLRLSYPELSAAIALCDASGGETLKRAFFELDCPVPRMWLAGQTGETGKTRSFFNLLSLASRLKPRVVISLTADLASVKRTWISRLAQPVLAGQADYTAPFYHSLNFDIPVTSLFGYPLFRSIFGRRLRQPFYTDRAFSLELAERFLRDVSWPADLPFAASELNMAARTIDMGARICQSFMATPRLRWQNAPLGVCAGKDFLEVAFCLFTAVENTPDVWGPVRRSKPTPVTGTELTPSIIAPREQDDTETVVAEIRKLASRHGLLWHRAFGGRKDWIMEKIAGDTSDCLSMSTDEWSYVCYRSLAAFRRIGGEERRDFIEALSAVFMSRMLSWLRAGTGLSLPQMEAMTEEECRIFESNRPDFIESWNAAG
jgi:hypothetical protein